jgi:hypothetical protein
VEPGGVGGSGESWRQTTSERHGRPRPEEAAFPFKLAVALGGVDAAIVGFVLC